MQFLLFIAGFSVDLIVALMMGTTFYFLWDWLIIPTVEIVTLSWTAAVMIAFVARFLTRPATDVFNIDMDDLWPLMGRILGNSVARCISVLILGAILSFMV